MGHAVKGGLMQKALILISLCRLTWAKTLDYTSQFVYVRRPVYIMIQFVFRQNDFYGSIII